MITSPRRCGGLALAVLAGATAPIAAQCQTEWVPNPAPTEDTYFGSGPSIEGDVMLVGAPNADPNGAAWVLRRVESSWEPEAVLLPTEDIRTSDFGVGVDLDRTGTLAIVGAYTGVQPSTSIFRHVGGQWVREIELLGPRSSQFGLNVAIDGDVALVGARYDRDEHGAVYVYRHANGTWQEEAMLIAPGGGYQSQTFGNSVAVQGNVALIGSSATPLVGREGEAWVFRFDGEAWGLEATLSASDGVDSNQFGLDVDLDGDLAVVTAQRHDGANENGAVYMFRLEGDVWHEEVRFVRPWRFGGTIAAREHRVVVGTRDGEPSLISTFQYDPDTETWSEAEPLITSSRVGSESVAFDGRTVAVGDRGATVDGIEGAGAVLLFDLLDPLGPDCDDNGVCDAQQIGEGLIEDCNENAIPDVCEGLPDGDDDGLPDACDNCPGHANPDQADCDRDGIGDTCAIAEGLSEDCDDNGVPDECDPDCNGNGFADGCDILEGRSEDCDDNGIPDECDIDCNDNDVPDACDIAGGASEDCNEDGVPDECALPYRRDDGTAEGNYGIIPGDREIIWLQQFEVRAGEEIAFGLGVAWFELKSGLPAKLLLYDDPNNDGDPVDGVLLRVVDVVTETAEWDVFSVAPIPPTVLGEAGDRFFVGATIYEEWPMLPMAADVSSPPQLAAWWGAGDFDEPIDLERLDRLAVGPRHWTSVNVMLRAYSALDGISCIPGDVDASGQVDFDDLLLVLAAWGDCPAPPDACPVDLDGDGRVGLGDLLIVLSNWTR